MPVEEQLHEMRTRYGPSDVVTRFVDVQSLNLRLPFGAWKRRSPRFSRRGLGRAAEGVVEPLPHGGMHATIVQPVRRHPLDACGLAAWCRLGRHWPGSEDDREFLPDLVVACVVQDIAGVGVRRPGSGTEIADPNAAGRRGVAGRNGKT